MNFLEKIFRNLRDSPALAKIIEIHLTTPRGTDGHGLLELIGRARGWFHAHGVRAGDRVASLAPNSVRWVAADLATLAEGAIAVPMFDRSTPEELGKVLRSAEPVVVIVANASLKAIVETAWPERGEARIVTHEELFAHELREAELFEPEPTHPIAIIYTSGTSGEPKGVVLSRRNLDFMIPKILERLATVTVARAQPDRVFHFLPFCFAASRLMLWTQLSRPNPVMLSTDLTKMQAEFASARPNYFLTVPMVLERIRSGAVEQIRKRGGIAVALYDRGVAAHRALAEGRGTWKDRLSLAAAKKVLFSKVKAKIGPELDFVISGSAPLSEDTQRWFELLGVPVYQAYGLTETTGIVSLDDPARFLPGRVGHPISGVETRVSDEGELLVHGPNVFEGYWNNPDATAAAMDDGWFRTGDQVEVLDGNLKIVGRIKNLIIPESGHNVAPEPLEEQFLALCPSASQCVLVGHGRPFLAIIVTGAASQDEVDGAIERFNEGQPYYKKIKASILSPEVLTPDSGMLTANLKLRRREIERHFADRVDAVYTAYFAEKTGREGKPGEAVG